MNTSLVIILFFVTSVFADDWAREFDKPPIAGPYSQDLNRLVQNFSSQTWNKIAQDLRGNGKLNIKCFFASKTAVGVLQYMEIAAPKSVVQAVLDNVNGYQKLFPGYKKIELLAKRGEQWLTYWEQSVPFPFANVRYRMLYHIYDRDETHLYRDQLSWSEDIRYSDGAIGIAALAPEKTRYFEFDFWDIQPGLGSSMAASRIRRESVEAVYVSDRALQLKAEKAGVSSSESQRAARESLEANGKLIDSCLGSGEKFQPFW